MNICGKNRQLLSAANSLSVMPEEYDCKKNSCETGKYFVN
jgi:hypothetical protein